MNSSSNLAIRDVLSALKRADLAGTLGWQDVKQRYRRSKLGPFWLTISMGVLIAALGLVFGGIFKTPMREFLPFLATGIILWTYIATVINEGCTAFISSDAVIKQLPLPMFLHVMRVIWRNLVILAHNVVIIPLIFLLFLRPLDLMALLAIPGLVLSSLTLAWVALLAGVVCTRYRDLSQIVASVLQIAFYVTPIIWMPSLLSGRREFVFLDLNPFYHLIEIVRAPILGTAPTLTNWLVSLGMALIGWVFTLIVYARYKRRISYWL
ncbi:ABC transporter permease [Orrella daihaiensis]|uniref:ABC transporter permease n=1 Tax=Orrella daihaiensis TaxID=2782176 RepID=A0ABY4AHG4_9BURK|nr:ABC transporter permease [Orrella daihaiensis]UOD49731.1 ABC transporter permease [Orrella daihaiensis]